MSAFEEGNRLYYQERDYAGALDCYRSVPLDDPAYPTAQRLIGHNILGRAWGRWAEGIPHLETAIGLAPNDPKVLEDLGRAYVAVGRLSEGRALLQRAGSSVAEDALRNLDSGG
jgi:tetratricopeptide (TPR) repeat protein